MQISVVLKILNKSKLWIAQPVSIFMKQVYSLANLWPHISVARMKNNHYWLESKGNKVTRNMSKYSVCHMKVLPTCFFPQSYPKESHHNLKIVKRKVGKWQQGHEKFHTHTGTYSWHLRKQISFPSTSWCIFSPTPSSTGPDGLQREAIALPHANR